MRLLSMAFTAPLAPAALARAAASYRSMSLPVPGSEALSYQIAAPLRPEPEPSSGVEAGPAPEASPTVGGEKPGP